MDGAALLMQYGQMQKPESSDIGSSLALQLQQLLRHNSQQKQQQEQQQERQHEQHEHDHSFDEFSGAEFMQIEADPLGDPVFNYISDMVTDEGCLYDHRTCMFIDSSAYQANMAKDMSSVVYPGFAAQQLQIQQQQQLQEHLEFQKLQVQQQELLKLQEFQKQEEFHQSLQQQNDLWVDGLFDLPPEAESTSCTSFVEPEDVFRDGFFGEVQSDIENSEKKSSSSAATSMSKGEVGFTAKDEQELEHDRGPKTTGAPTTARVSRSKKRNGEVDLCSLLVECAEALADRELATATDNTTQDLWWSDDLKQQNHFVSGTIRDVEIDNVAVEAEKKLKIELSGLLVECAQAVAADDMTKAYQIVNGVRDRVSPRGNGTERMVFYFAEALVARITGTGALLYGALLNQKPPLAEMLKAYMVISRYLPNVRICHYFMNQTILNVTEGATRIHIVDYGIMYGFQWPCLIKALASRPGGAPHLRITGIDFPQPGFKPAERIEETGRKLAEYAKQVGVAFEFRALATAKWESVQASTLFPRHDEVLIVNSTFRLRHLLDESVMVDSPRKIVLSRIRAMKPKVLIESVVSASYNVPFFLTRFKEALMHYGAIFEAIDTTVSPEFAERHLIEQSIMGREILNVISCDGVERVERAESYKQWQSRTLKAGFEQLPLSAEIFSKAKAMMSTYHKGFGIGQDGNWLLLGWRERILHAMSTWTAL